MVYHEELILVRLDLVLYEEFAARWSIFKADEVVLNLDYFVYNVLEALCKLLLHLLPHLLLSLDHEARLLFLGHSVWSIEPTHLSHSF